MCVRGQDESVKELAQDLADRLDLKTCKAYMCVQVSKVSAPGGAERTGKVDYSPVTELHVQRE